MNIYFNICKKISDAILILCSITLVVITGIISLQIFDRYILNDSPNWSESLSIFLMNWYVLLAVAVGVKENFHLGLDLLRNRLNGIVKKLVSILIYLLIAGFSVSMVIEGSNLMIQTWTHEIPALGISNAWSYLPLTISGILLVIFSIENILHILVSKEN